MKVTIREKKIKNGKLSLYLDYYPPISVDDRQTRREFLSLYVYEKPKTELEREHNKETRILAQNIRARRQLDLQANEHGFLSRSKRTGDFLKFFKSFVDKRKTAAQTTWQTWNNSYNHLSDFCGGNCTFNQIDRDFVERYREYLLSAPSRRWKKNKISTSTAKIYFERFRTVVRAAHEQKYLPDNPLLNIKNIKSERRQSGEFLTLDELKKLAATPCHNMPEDLRRAALFSALTGLRHSDIQKLVWSEVQQSAARGDYLNLQIQKTGEQITLPISDEARTLLGERGNSGESVFPNLRYSNMIVVYLGRWLIAAGIGKSLTFHAFRRTFATAQITLGSDLYTVQKMLGHSDIRQTQIYAALVDEKKREAANRISLK
jgi:integrase